MQPYGVSLKHVDNSAIQSAIASKAHPDIIVRLKAQVAFNCVTDFEYHEVPFEDLGNLLCSDVGFNNFEFADVSTAIYNKDKHPNAAGRIRGVNNIVSGCNWICYDVDVTDKTDVEMHQILGNINHHLARTSDINKAYKYRIIIPLTETVKPTRDEWKHFMQSIATLIGIGKVDRLAQSAVLYGYENREVMSMLNGTAIDPSTHLKMARMRVAEDLARNEVYGDVRVSQDALDNPFNTFSFAFQAQEGDRWRTAHAAIHKAKMLGADTNYIKDLMYQINDFLDQPKSHAIVEASLFSAI